MEDGNSYVQIAWPEALLEDETALRRLSDAVDRFEPGGIA